jgi:2-polyprenyl-3-methyl-5-hydroxy-6-metoxy-1,4-benzoquinol methylase
MYNRLFSTGDYEQHREEFRQLQQGKPAWGMFRKRMLKRIERMSPGRRMIEIGGGTGAFGVLAKLRGWDYLDYDLSEAAVTFAQQLGLEARTFPADQCPPLPPRSADVVVMWEVLEHVWNVHEYLAAIHNALVPGGLLVLSTPNAGSLRGLEQWGPFSLPPIHCNFFTAASLANVLQEHSLEARSVYGRRLYLPRPNLASIRMALRFALRLVPAETLIAIAVCQRTNL